MYTHWSVYTLTLTRVCTHTVVQGTYSKYWCCSLECHRHPKLSTSPIRFSFDNEKGPFSHHFLLSPPEVGSVFRYHRTDTETDIQKRKMTDLATWWMSQTLNSRASPASCILELCGRLSSKEAYLYDFPWDQEVKNHNRGKSRKTLLSWQGISKAAALTNFKAFAVLWGLPWKSVTTKGLGKAAAAPGKHC